MDYSTYRISLGAWAFWKINDATGTAAVDSSGSGHNAIWTSLPSLTNGLLSNDPDLASQPSTSQNAAITSFTQTDNITIDCWVQFSASVASGAFVWGNGAFGLYFSATNTLSIIVQNVKVGPTNSFTISPNARYYVAVVRRAGTWELWVNNTLIGSSSLYAPTQASATFYIGGGSFGVTPSGMTIEKMGVSTTALSTAQLTQLYQYGTIQYPSSPTVSISSAGGQDTVTVTAGSTAGTYPVAQYDLYRGTSPGAETGVSLGTITPGGFPASFAAQSSAPAGTTYFYVAKATDNLGFQGPASNEVSHGTSRFTPSGVMRYYTSAAPYGYEYAGLSGIGYTVVDADGIVVTPHTTTGVQERVDNAGNRTGVYWANVQIDTGYLSGAILWDAPPGVAIFEDDFNSYDATAANQTTQAQLKAAVDASTTGTKIATIQLSSDGHVKATDELGGSLSVPLGTVLNLTQTALTGLTAPGTPTGVARVQDVQSAPANFNIIPVSSTTPTGVVTSSPITVYQNSAQSVPITVTDAAGNAVNLSGKTLKFNVYDETDPQSIKFSYSTTASSITISGASNNVATVQFSATDTAGFGSFKYILWNTTNNVVLANAALQIKEVPQ